LTASEEGGETIVAELEFEVFRLEVNQQLSIDKEGPYRATPHIRARGKGTR
jgi:hypothetical protein